MIQRNRLPYSTAIGMVILAGLGSRKFAPSLPSFIADYAGDTLWALLVFLLIGLAFPRRSTLQVATAALLFSFAIEISQLYHDSWIDSIRSTTAGGLVLGFTFLWSDLLCYTAGVAIGVVVELLWNRTSPISSLRILDPR